MRSVDDHDLAVQLILAGAPTRYVAGVTGVSAMTISRLARDEGIILRKGRLSRDKREARDYRVREVWSRHFGA